MIFYIFNYDITGIYYKRYEQESQWLKLWECQVICHVLWMKKFMAEKL